MLEVRSLSKRYGPVQALDRVSASFLPGEVHAVLGENGAGKSTLMQVVAGFLLPDEGTVTLEGKSLPLGHPIASRAAGVEMVHQHFMLVPAFTVEENLALARLGSLAGTLDTARLAQPALDFARELGWSLDPKTRTGGLPVGIQQRVEILKALSGDAPVLIFDEPTAVLTPDEVDDLFRVLRRLRDRGKTILLIAHKLAEVMAVADRVTVLRRGHFVATAPIGEVNERRLATWMVGDLPTAIQPLDVPLGPVLLEARDLVVLGDRREEAVGGIGLEVRGGELLGIGGVDGNGQVELAEALVGIRPLRSGQIERRSRDPKTAATVGYIPQDRQADGLALTLSIFDNLMIAGTDRPGLRRGPLLRIGAARQWADRVVERFQIKIGGLSDPVSGLSGGNQQKVVVGRTLDAIPDVIVAMNPTRGLDIRATDFVHQTLLDAARAGAAIVLISTDLDELAALASRTVFMSRGRWTSTLLGASA
mgnify:CR=1 FL=1